MAPKFSLFTERNEKCCNLHNAFMVRRLGLGKNNHLTYASLALNPRGVTFYDCINTIYFPLIQEGQLSVSGERICTVLVNRLED